MSIKWVVEVARMKESQNNMKRPGKRIKSINHERKLHEMDEREKQQRTKEGKK